MSSKKNKSVEVGVHLTVSKQNEPAVYPDRCIICQKKKPSESLHGGTVGRKRVREVAEQTDDDVHKRLKILESDYEFKYHNSYACYKNYTDARKNPASVSTDTYTMDTDIQIESPSVTPLKPATRSSVTPRPGPSTGVDSRCIECVICGNDRVWVKSQKKHVRDKYRICDEERAKKFLEAVNQQKDEVFVRCADLKTPSDVYAADLYCH